MGTHYSDAQNMVSLRAWASKKAMALKAFTTYRRKTPRKLMLCYTGMSGIAYATALAMELDSLGVKVEMAYVRKIGEVSHGVPVEASNMQIPSKDFTIIFVDDFVDTGKTLERVKEGLKTHIGPGAKISKVVVWDIDESAREYLKQNKLGLL